MDNRLFKRIPTPEEYEIERARKALSLIDGPYSVVSSENYNNNKKPTIRIRRPLKGASSISQHGYNKNKESFQEHIARCQYCRAISEREQKALWLNGAI